MNNYSILFEYTWLTRPHKKQPISKIQIFLGNFRFHWANNKKIR